MKVEQIEVKNGLRNFTYVIYDEMTAKAWSIDPYDAKQVIRFLHSKSLSLEMVVNTHQHFDHTRGNKGLLKHFQCGLYDLESQQKDIPLLGNWKLKTLFVPGHTMDHVAFLLMDGEQQFGFFGGDTIFHSGIGNCTNGGNVEVFFDTIQKIKQEVQPETLLYTGHDYGLSNLRFSLSVKDDRTFQNELSQFRKTSKRIFPFARELEFNLFLQCKVKEDFITLRAKRDKW